MNSNFKLIFIGTPDFAATSLSKLINANYNIVSVITAPDKASGRGKKITKSAVKLIAEKNNLNILQPTNLKAPDFVKSLKTLQADLQIVVAFRILPEIVWNMPRLGTINLHGSVLPQYRGAAPINWAIINGEKITGVSTFFLKHEIDTGNIIKSASINIDDDDNMGSLHDKLMYLGAQLILETVQSVKENNYTETEQEYLDKKKLKFAPKIFKETCAINWNKTPIEIQNFIRGMSPYPGAYTFILINGKEDVMKIFATKLIPSTSKTEKGTIITDGKKKLNISLGETQELALLQIQLPGKKRLLIRDFLAGLGSKKFKIKL